jgi:hypothetical protein
MVHLPSLLVIEEDAKDEIIVLGYKLNLPMVITSTCAILFVLVIFICAICSCCKNRSRKLNVVKVEGYQNQTYNSTSALSMIGY